MQEAENMPITVRMEMDGDKFIVAEEVEPIARRLINEVHPGLAEATILYLFRNGEWSSKGKDVLGQAAKVPEHWKCLYGYELMIVINARAWINLSERQKAALLDHELSHFCKEEDKKGYAKYSVVPHDVEEFSGVIERHGLWKNDVKRFAEVVQTQLSIIEAAME